MACSAGMLTKSTPMPSDEELTVPHEITLSTPYFKAVIPYMHKACEKEIKDFMLRRQETEDPRLSLKEGRALTACGIKFLQSLKKVCSEKVDRYADCIDHRTAKLYITPCREQQRRLDICVEENLNIIRPRIGYFSKLHVHNAHFPKYVHYTRDYKTEAAKILAELPDDYHLREDSRAYEQQRYNFFDI
ncbi:unnamed protein product [Acanthocheilonema viteae]|uniref:COX assembly mitochondrial protein n=1 Tax=Acanthocheilonema viteae TaxID=6277 RepID=A0A498S7J2_ACAVI|nr:unnamed protein product [Acanthocheilonema viteae]VBB27635.1 unnamed protein product [Acanthocheilonema viteae]